MVESGVEQQPSETTGTDTAEGAEAGNDDAPRDVASPTQTPPPAEQTVYEDDADSQPDGVTVDTALADIEEPNTPANADAGAAVEEEQVIPSPTPARLLRPQLPPCPLSRGQRPPMPPRGTAAFPCSVSERTLGFVSTVRGK